MTLLLVDGNSIMNRMYFGMRALTTADGKNTNAVYGFLNLLFKAVEDLKPDGVAVAFDLPVPTFRHKMYAEYKAGRHEMQDELREQFPYIKEILPALGYTVVTCEGFEADDILGTLSNSGADMSYIVSGDKDTLQLIGENCHILLAGDKSGNGSYTEYDEALLLEKYELTPSEMITLKALCGDSSDHFPGVKGMGPKTATPLIKQYHTLDEIYEHLDEYKPRVAGLLDADKDSAYMCLKLGTIVRDAPIERNLKKYKIGKPDKEKLAGLLADLELNSFIKKLGLTNVKVTPKRETTSVECVEITAEEFEKKASEEPICYISGEFDGCDLLSISLLADEKVYFCHNSDFITESILNTFLSSDLPKITDKSKAFYSFAEERGIDVKNIIFDTTLAAYVLNPDLKGYEIENLCPIFIPTLPQSEDENPLAITAALPQLKEILSAELSKNGQMKLLTDIEMPFARVLASMEYYGFRVDKDGIKLFGEVLSDKIDTLLDSIYDQAGEIFNVNSPKQLGEILFDKLGLPAKKKTKTGYSTNADVLEELAYEYPIVADVLSYRTLAKLKSTYCDGLLKTIGRDGRIHSTFNQTETRTGRISSSEPNLQNIPVRTALGAELRKFFIADKGYTLVDADYSQIELRVLAAVSGDENMLDCFRNGTDIHTTTASRVFNMPVDYVTPQMRSSAKAVNFGIVYGIGAFSLSKDIGVSVREADRFIKNYLSVYSGVASYMTDIIESAKKQGFVSTISGRRRYVPELSSANAIQRKFGERVARNMPIQGTAADIIKLAMINVYERLKREKLRSRLILQVHDELIIETAVGEEEQVSALLKEEMENAMDLGVRLIADVHSGDTWYEAKG